MLDTTTERKHLTRRDLLRHTAALAGGVVVAHGFPWLHSSASTATWRARAEQPAAAADAVAAMRSEMAKAPIETLTLASNLMLLSGPGGNIVILHGPDGKVVVDSFVQPVWPKLKSLVDGMGNAPLKLLIDTHWHFDHSDNNANFRAAGADILAHANTKTRLSESHDLLGMHFAPAPPAALPTQTFVTTHKLQANGEAVELGHIPPAHTDTDIYIRYPAANVLHLGDVFFNGMYPFIDASTGGSIGGMITGATRGLALADRQTKIVPGHGPLGDHAALTRYRDMLVTVRERVQKLKTSGRTLAEVTAQKPTADLDVTWGKGFMQPNDFVGIVYNTL